MPVIGYYNGYYLEVATQVGIFVALALGLNIVVGLAGLLDLGYVAFFAVGAYTWAIFGSPQANLIFGGGAFPLAPGWFYPFLLVGLLVAAGTGLLLGLPVLRLHGDYLAIVTLGFGEVIRVLANNLDKPINITNGPKGITPIVRPPMPFGLPTSEAFYFLVFVIPASFTVLESIGVLAMVILGGMGSIPGAVIGATVVTVLNLQVLKGLSLWLNELKNAGVTVLGYSLTDLPTQLEPAKYERMI